MYGTNSLANHVRVCWTSANHWYLVEHVASAQAREETSSWHFLEETRLVSEFSSAGGVFSGERFTGNGFWTRATRWLSQFKISCKETISFTCLRVFVYMSHPKFSYLFFLTNWTSPRRYIVTIATFGMLRLEIRIPSYILVSFSVVCRFSFAFVYPKHAQASKFLANENVIRWAAARHAWLSLQKVRTCVIFCARQLWWPFFKKLWRNLSIPICALWSDAFLNTCITIKVKYPCISDMLVWYWTYLSYYRYYISFHGEKRNSLQPFRCS